MPKWSPSGTIAMTNVHASAKWGILLGSLLPSNTHTEREATAVTQLDEQIWLSRIVSISNYSTYQKCRENGGIA